jgi:hypothetical protein
MKVKMAMALLALIQFVGTAGLAGAQDETKTTHKKTRTLRGCLQKGDDANEYKLTTAKGSTWEIKSDNVKLGEHVGRQVRGERTRSRQGFHRAWTHDGDEFEYGQRELPTVRCVTAENALRTAYPSDQRFTSA